MGAQLGENPWILIVLIFLEILFVIVPAFISSKIESKSFTTLLSEMGFQKDKDYVLKIIAGLGIGILFFFSGDFILIFFRNIVVENLLGAGFIKEGQEGVISTTPIQPNVIQVLIIASLQIIIVGPCEEAFFRAFLIKKVNVKFKVVYSIIISSIIFAFYHVPPFLVPLPTVITFFGYYFIFGVLLALIFVYFNYSIIPCSIAHSCFNILLLLI
ncbi:MAG: CPBP family intramembrane glutamic endopeptidase [Candidatus Thorarchaeota archaeon]